MKLCGHLPIALGERANGLDSALWVDNVVSPDPVFELAVKRQRDAQCPLVDPIHADGKLDYRSQPLSRMLFLLLFSLSTLLSGRSALPDNIFRTSTDFCLPSPLPDFHAHGS